MSTLVSRNYASQQASKKRSSMRLEPELWTMLTELCEREGRDLGAIIDEQRGYPGTRTSAIRAYVARYFHVAATEVGHATAGHRPLVAGVLTLRHERTKRQ